MARIRTIKPEFWQDEKLAPLDPLTRLVFLGLISQADDAGRLVDSVRMLDGLLFPHTDDSCRDALETLATLSRITRYTSESGQDLIQIRGWDTHQRVDRPSKYVLPAPPTEVVTVESLSEHSRDTRETLARIHCPDHGSTTWDRGSTNVERGEPTSALIRGVRAQFGWRGTEGTDPVLLKAFPEDEDARDRCLEIAFTRWETDAAGQPFNSRFFRSILTAVVDEQTPAKVGGVFGGLGEE